MAKKNWMNEILGGQILLKSGILEQARYVLFVFVLVIIYISINFGMERSLLIERRNQRELRHLKADFTSKSSRLQFQSKRVEVEKRLIELSSTIKAPVNPPGRLIIED